MHTKLAIYCKCWISYQVIFKIFALITHDVYVSEIETNKAVVAFPSICLWL